MRVIKTHVHARTTVVRLDYTPSTFGDAKYMLRNEVWLAGDTTNGYLRRMCMYRTYTHS